MKPMCRGLAFWVAAFLAACTASPASAPAATPPATAPPTAPQSAANPSSQEPMATITIGQDECELDPSLTETAAGAIQLRAVNETDALAAFDMWRIGESGSLDQLVAHIAEERRLAESGDPGLGHPSFASSLISSGILQAGESKLVSGVTQPGTYGIVCLRHFVLVTDDPFRPFTVVGPITIH
jgi:hypothetical protein